MIGRDSHRSRLNLEKQDPNCNLEIAQLVTSEGTAEAAAQSFGGAQMSEYERATRCADPVPPASDREKCAR